MLCDMKVGGKISLPATVKFMISIYRKDHFSSFLERIHIMITVPVASAESVLHANVGVTTQSWNIVTIIPSCDREQYGVFLLSTTSQS